MRGLDNAVCLVKSGVWVDAIFFFFLRKISHCLSPFGASVISNFREWQMSAPSARDNFKNLFVHISWYNLSWSPWGTLQDYAWSSWRTWLLVPSPPRGGGMRQDAFPPQFPSFPSHIFQYRDWSIHLNTQIRCNLIFQSLALHKCLEIRCIFWYLTEFHFCFLFLFS